MYKRQVHLRPGPVAAGPRATHLEPVVLLILLNFPLTGRRSRLRLTDEAGPQLLKVRRFPSNRPMQRRISQQWRKLLRPADPIAPFARRKASGTGDRSMLATGPGRDVKQLPGLIDVDLMPDTAGHDHGLAGGELDVSIPVLQFKPDPDPT